MQHHRAPRTNTNIISTKSTHTHNNPNQTNISTDIEDLQYTYTSVKPVITSLAPRETEQNQARAILCTRFGFKTRLTDGDPQTEDVPGTFRINGISSKLTRAKST